ncbi:MAG: hypothetical protein CBC38_05425 [Gammaproteobacteria bacterium TMED78]|nr:MAG: hypothetical protein CBC38_05425 [Gammaproteobacteria bacterium TMED78]|tara:strand:+ start:64284 stop:66158 length:1875 start_codon:yes stop_codon:yes gene_type:complete
MKRMIINAAQKEELRVAMVDGQRLYDLNIELPSKEQKKANIYKGRISRVEPSLDAVFVDYGNDRHGFLPIKEISPEYFSKPVPDGERVQIKDVLKENQQIVVQVEKEERGNKGAALTTYISLAGRFLVLMPNNPKASGVSRRITGPDRDIVQNSLKELNLSEEMGCIVRTAGVGRDNEELKWDLEYLLNVWDSIKKEAVSRPATFLIYQESNAIIRAIRDYLTNDVGEILIEGKSTFDEAKIFMSQVMPHNIEKLKEYDDKSVPLFTRFQVESQIESAFSHSVSLPSGGSIVIDHNEALTAIDINSSRSTKGGDIEDTALNTNLEAATELARQLRIRDLGGLVVIDFIDMLSHSNQRKVVNKLKDEVRTDKARIQIGRISKFGLLEMSRQRIRPSLDESMQSVCPRCNGVGRIRGIESLALAILRLISEESRKDNTSKVIANIPVDVCNYILNEKRNWVESIQKENNINIVIVGNQYLDSPNYSIKRIKENELDLPENISPSYKQVDDTQVNSEFNVYESDNKPIQKPAVSNILPTRPAPKPKSDKSIFSMLFGWLFPKKKNIKKKYRKRYSRNKKRKGNYPKYNNDKKIDAKNNKTSGSKNTRKKYHKKRTSRKNDGDANSSQ